MAIQLFVPKFEVDECLNQIRECLEKGWTGLGYKTQQIEEAWRHYTGLEHAHFISSNTVGLHIALRIFKTKYGWNDGDEIITTPLTFVSTNHAILYEHLTPVFADVDEYLCLDPIDVEKKINAKTRAIMFVGLGGNIGQYEKIKEICHRYGLKLILDAAHMSGTKCRGQHVGFDADASIFSFQAVKNLPTADSGMICFKDAEDDERVRKLTWLGINKDTYSRTSSQGSYKWMYEVEELGFKYHGNSIMASLALVALKYLDRDNEYRRKIAQWYIDELEQNPNVRLVPVAPDCQSSRHLVQIRVSNRDELMQKLNLHEIFPGVHYRDNTEYHLYSASRGLCQNAQRASAELLSLPVHMYLTESDVKHIAQLINEYAK